MDILFGPPQISVRYRGYGRKTCKGLLRPGSPQHRMDTFSIEPAYLKDLSVYREVKLVTIGFDDTYSLNRSPSHFSVPSYLESTKKHNIGIGLEPLIRWIGSKLD